MSEPVRTGANTSEQVRTGAHRFEPVQTGADLRGMNEFLKAEVVRKDEQITRMDARLEHMNKSLDDQGRQYHQLAMQMGKIGAALGLRMGKEESEQKASDHTGTHTSEPVQTSYIEPEHDDSAAGDDTMPANEPVGENPAG